MPKLLLSLNYYKLTGFGTTWGGRSYTQQDVLLLTSKSGVNGLFEPAGTAAAQYLIIVRRRYDVERWVLKVVLDIVLAGGTPAAHLWT